MSQILTTCGCQDAVGTCSSSSTPTWGLVESTESPAPQVGPSEMHTVSLRTTGVVVRWPQVILETAVSVQWCEQKPEGSR